ncbi:hypothetical protein BYT27DRAFT_7207536 [Phlegmacium glaucopus]|nr:hypothetical protein BYT27DRAFT_7207536 [Phlegmacium glaucopus]
MEWESESSDDDLDELEGAKLVESPCKGIENEMDLLKQLELEATQTPYKRISNVKLTTKEWRKVEQNQRLGYNGLASWTQRQHQQQACEKAENNKIMQKLIVMYSQRRHQP